MQVVPETECLAANGPLGEAFARGKSSCSLESLHLVSLLSPPDFGFQKDISRHIDRDIFSVQTVLVLQEYHVRN